MRKNTIGLFGVARQQCLGHPVRLGEFRQRLVQIAALLVILAHRMQYPRAPLQTLGGHRRQIILILIIIHRPLVDLGHHIEPADPLQLGTQIGQHIFDQPLGLGLLMQRFVARLDCEDCHPDHR